MRIDDHLIQRISNWNGNPADYPWFERSPELAARFESGDLNEVLFEGCTRGEILQDLEYHEQWEYVKTMPDEVRQYRAKLSLAGA